MVFFLGASLSWGGYAPEADRGWQIGITGGRGAKGCPLERAISQPPSRKCWNPKNYSILLSEERAADANIIIWLNRNSNRWLSLSNKKQDEQIFFWVEIWGTWRDEGVLPGAQSHISNHGENLRYPKWKGNFISNKILDMTSWRASKTI